MLNLVFANLTRDKLDMCTFCGGISVGNRRHVVFQAVHNWARKSWTGQE